MMRGLYPPPPSASSVRISLSLQTGHCSVKQGSLATDVYEVGVHVGREEHQLLTLERVVAEFPHCSEELVEERRGEKRIQQEENPAVALSALKAKMVFPYMYRFGDTLNKVRTVLSYTFLLHQCNMYTYNHVAGNHTH